MVIRHMLQVAWMFAIVAIIVFISCGPDFDNPLDPKNNPEGSALTAAGWANYESGKLDKAVTQFRQAITQNSQDLEARVGLGWSLFQNQDVQGAINEFQLALVVDPNAVDAHAGLAGAYLATEGYKSAIDHAQSALRLQPKYTFAHDPLITSKNLHLVLAESYYYLGDFTRAQEEIGIVDPSIEIDQNNIESDLLMALEELTQSIDGR